MGGCSCDSRLVPRLCLIDLSVCAGMARQLEGGHGHLAEMVQAVKNHGAGALHFTAGCKMVEVCEYLLRMSRWTWMSLTKQAHGSLREKNWRRFLLDIQKMETLGDLALLQLCSHLPSQVQGMARQLEGGHDHLAEMVQAAKNQGARALHFTAGCKMVEVCEYLLRISRWTWMSLTKQCKIKIGDTSLWKILPIL
ncbi:uncharacterized protein [Triticum aestivum]|uniref:uncharacterized protein isoform X4 n=2 Tax=Triticum aestivum TaxID=4565 RepID=UPI001D021786|nr:uncharacterized protein LOC123070819 isoform X4 [Triticum aestivum]